MAISRGSTFSSTFVRGYVCKVVVIKEVMEKRVHISCDTANTIADISGTLREIKNNSQLRSIFISVKQVGGVFRKDIDTLEKALNYRDGPLLSTRFVIHWICRELGKRSRLSSLETSSLHIPADCVLFLSPAFRRLSVLSLRHARIGDEGWRYICEELWRCGRLQVLDVTGCGISAEGVDFLEETLRSQAMLRISEERYIGLQRITLDYNRIGDAGFEKIIRIITDDQWMKAFDLRHCGIEKMNREALEVIRRNIDLEVMDLRGNCLKEVKQIIQTVLKNKPLEKAVYKWKNPNELTKYLC